MAAPKRKMSKSRRDKRRANWKLTVPGYVLCPQCHEPKTKKESGRSSLLSFCLHFNWKASIIKRYD